MANLLKIKEIAERRNIPLRKLAESVGVSENQIHVMCRTNSTKIETLEKIANALNVHISVFFDSPLTPTNYISTQGSNNGILIAGDNNSGDISCTPASIVNERINHLEELLAEKNERIKELKERIEELKEK